VTKVKKNSSGAKGCFQKGLDGREGATDWDQKIPARDRYAGCKRAPKKETKAGVKSGHQSKVNRGSGGGVYPFLQKDGPGKAEAEKNYHEGSWGR